MSKNSVRDSVPLSRFGVLVAQLESIVASAVHKPPDPLLCFDLLSDLVSAIDVVPKDSILLCQRKCEDALYSLVTLGARSPVRHLSSEAMARIIMKGDHISIYSRASSLQGFLSDGKKNEPLQVAGAAQCLGELYHHFGRRITSGLQETTTIVTKLLKFNEEFVRQEALQMLQNALEGSGGCAASSAYTEAFRLIMRLAGGDKSFTVRIATARCLKAFANIGGPGLGIADLDNSSSFCVKALEDPVSAVRDAFSEALGALLALGMNPEAQVQLRGKGHFTPKKLEGGLQRHLALPFIKAAGTRSKHLRIGITFAWVFFLQAIRLKYMHPDNELQSYALQVMDMLRADMSVDAQALACVLYILRVGVTDQMTEPAQRGFSAYLGQQLQSSDASPAMQVASLRTLSYTLRTLGEVPVEFKEVLDNIVVMALSHSSSLVRVEGALTLHALAEVDPTCVGGLVSYGVTTLNALRENVSFEKGTNLKVELDSLHGQATVLAALVSISPKLPLGYPASLPRSVLGVSKRMLTESSRNPLAAIVEKEAGWILLSSLLASMPKEELVDQVFDILSLWASLFSGHTEHQIKKTEDLISTICVWSAAVDALTTFIRRFVSPNALNKGILLQPVLLYLNRALSYMSSLLAAKEQESVKPVMDIFVARLLVAYQSLSDPMLYKSDHFQIIQICTSPFRDGSRSEESSCLRMLLDRRDAWLGPWIPGRDWFEDELRAFGGGKDGVLPCVWEDEPHSFPQPESVGRMLVNQKLLCFGIMFACQDASGMLSLLTIIDQCLKTGKKQSWHAASVTNICVGLIAGLKALIALRPQPLGLEILNSVQSIFQGILAEGDICPSQCRASSEGLGLLARLGNDIFTARLIRTLLSDLTGTSDSNYVGSIAFALGCLHRSAGGMALSSLVPATVNSISSLAKSSVASVQIWSLHGLLLTIEAAGLSYVSHVQATLGLALDILLSVENGLVDLRQGVGRLINAIVAVLGPELAPGSILFSRCKSVIAEISSRQETATLLESVRFTQQLVLFAPHAVTVHSHVQTLLPTLSSRQPVLRQLAVSTLRHLIEKDPVSVIDEQIEEVLFHMLDDETDSEIGSLVRTTIMRLLYASAPSRPSRWLYICHKMILGMSLAKDGNNNLENDPSIVQYSINQMNSGEDDENMVSSSKSSPIQTHTFDSSIVTLRRDKHLRFRTRVFAAECLSHVPAAIGKNPAHFDISLARRQSTNEQDSGDWLVLKLQDLISLAYQISTIQFENMRHIGIGLLVTIVDKFQLVPDPELPGQLLLEQYQAQLVSALRTALDISSGPVLLEAGLHLATKILTSGITRGEQAAVKRIFSLISRPLNDFNDLYYPSFAEWVSCKIKVRLLNAHASLKCYTYAFLKREKRIPDEYLLLLPLFSESSSRLKKYWICVLKDYIYTSLGLHPKINWKSFLDEIQSPLVLSMLLPCLEEAWPAILQALALDAVPVNSDAGGSPKTTKDMEGTALISGYRMVELELEEFQILWSFALLILFKRQDPSLGEHMILARSFKSRIGGDSSVEDSNSLAQKLYDVALSVFQFLSTAKFFSAGYLSLDVSIELLQVFSYSFWMEGAFDSLSISVLLQIVQNCPEDFLETENYAYLSTELCLVLLYKFCRRIDTTSPYYSNWDDVISLPFVAATTILRRLKHKMQLEMMLPLLLIGYKYIGQASNESYLTKSSEFLQHIFPLLKNYVDDKSKFCNDDICFLITTIGACLNVIASLAEDCIWRIKQLESKKSASSKLLHTKLGYSLEQSFSFAELAYEIECIGENQESKPILFAMICHCVDCIHNALSDSNIQVQAIGLQVLRGLMQRGINARKQAFTIFFIGELLSDVLTIIQIVLKKPMNKESVTIAGECLKTLMLLQTLSKSSECQKTLSHMLLETSVMVFSVSEDNLSQEANDLRVAAIKLVSQLAQLPSSAIYIRDVMLEMPVAQRQKLQGIIRCSVTQDQNPTQIKSTGQSLVIKLPTPLKDNREKFSASFIPTKQSDDRSGEKEEDWGEKNYASLAPSKMSGDSSGEEEEDWDAFQSFPASKNEDPSLNVDGGMEGPTFAGSSSTSSFNTTKNDFQQDSCLLLPGKLNKVIDIDKEAGKGEVLYYAVGVGDQMEESHSSEDDGQNEEECANPHMGQDECISGNTDNPISSDAQSVEIIYTEQCDNHHEEEITAGLSDGNDQHSSDVSHVEVAEECNGPLPRHGNRTITFPDFDNE